MSSADFNDGEYLYSASAEQSKTTVLAAVQYLALPVGALVLELASGTGQHVQYLAQQLPHVVFQPSDINRHMIATMQPRLTLATNVRPAVLLDARDPGTWRQTVLGCGGIKDGGDGWLHALLCANLLHVTQAECCEAVVRGAAQHLRPCAHLIIFGPFLNNGLVPTQLLAWQRRLTAENSNWGLRDADNIVTTARALNLTLVRDVHIGPAHRLIIFKKN